MASQSPSFANPPVIEVVLSVQFEPLGLTNGHLGWYWRQHLGADWPRPVDAPRIPDQVERFGGQRSMELPAMEFRVGPGPRVDRLQIRHSGDDRMVQIQDTRLIYNWIKKHGAYPRYSAIRREFDCHFDKFGSFAKEAELGELALNQWEVTYVNHIPRGELWNEQREWAEVLPGLLKSIDPYGGTRFETLAGQWQSEIPAERGRLHIEVQHREVKQQDDSLAGVLALHLTARGPINEDQDLNVGLSLGHETIVNTFVEISSGAARQFWGER